MQIINQHLPADPQADFDYGTTFSLLMAARLYSPMALSNVAQWAKDSGADILWDMPPEKINDDRLGRALDAFYRQTVPEDAPRKEHRATTRTILEAFSSYTLLIHHHRLGREVQPTHLTTRQREILQQLGLKTPAQILSQRLPRAPT